MAFVDGTVTNVALPFLQKELDATATELQWVVESYSLFLASLLLAGGALGDRLGRRRVFSAGVVLFAIASTCCGMVSTISQLIAARGVQGVGAALLVPGSLAILSASFDEERRGRAIGTWSAFTGITAAVGPVLGGWFVENVSWRWVFFINLPIALVVLALLWWRVPESRGEPMEGLDFLGAALATLGLGGLVYGLTESPVLGLGHPRVAGALAAGIAALGAFVAVEKRAPSPMVPLSLFDSREFTGTNILTFFLYMALGGALFFFPFNLVQLQRYSPTEAGLSLLPFILIMFLLSRWAGGLADRIGARLPLVAGPSIAALGFALFARPSLGGSYWTTFFPGVLVLALGMALSVAPLTTTVMRSVATSHAGVASGINNAVARTAGLLAIAVMGIILTTVFNRSLDRELSRLDLSPAQTSAVNEERSKLAGADPAPEILGGKLASVRRAVDLSFVRGFRTVMGSASVLALLGGLAAWWFLDPAPQPAVKKAGKTPTGRFTSPSPSTREIYS
jgi:EmrB/QacA subfamily drug resistance transporter